MTKKQHLPSKICPVCNRPFLWRKKWKSVWDDVKYCSKRCQGSRNLYQKKNTTAVDVNNSKRS